MTPIHDEPIAPPPAYRALGSSGVTISSIAWGTWRFKGADVDAARRKVEAAIDAGINLFDTADVYGPGYGEPFGAAEQMLGKVMAGAPELASRMVISTKGGIRRGLPYNSSEDYLTGCIDGSLGRLGIDSIDLWQVHRPDVLTHPAEIARTLEKAHAAGKIKAVGLSNFTIHQTSALRRYVTIPIVSHQPEFSCLETSGLRDGVFDQAVEHDMAILAWSPLGGGRIAAPTTDREAAIAAALDVKAAAEGVSRSSAAISWVMAHPARPIPILGTQSIDRIAEAAAASRISWRRSEWYAVLAAAGDHPLP